MTEVETEIKYPPEWVDEFKRCGFPPVWLSDFPELFVKGRGVHSLPPLPRKDKYCLAEYALMYLLRKTRGIESITYHRLAVKNSEARESHHPIMRKRMGDGFEKLQHALWDAGFSSTYYTGEPDLFCWHPDTDECFFAEAKGPKDKMSEPQEKWFKVCRETLPSMRIVVYRVLPEIN